MSDISTDYELYQNLGLVNPYQEETKAQGELAMEDFLNLMVTELTYQDPFKPMENSELATQISQFATVSGIESLNMSFEDLSASLVSNQVLMASNLVGRDVLVPTEYGYLGESGSISGVIGLSTSAANLTLKVYDEAGALVREMPMGNQEAGEVEFTWDGFNDAGEPMPPGEYKITAEADAEGESISPYVLVEAEVSSVNVNGQELILSLEGLGYVSFYDVVEIR